MFALLENGVVVGYPYSLRTLYDAHPNISFPAHMADGVLAEWGIVRVVMTGPPEFNPETHEAVEITPVFNAGMNRWEQSFVINPI